LGPKSFCFPDFANRPYENACTCPTSTESPWASVVPPETNFDKNSLESGVVIEKRKKNLLDARVEEWNH
jgi:hypothetical protein